MDDAQIGQNVGPDARWPLGLEQEPALGAHLTTSRRGYSHHGVYVGRGRVVHYSGLSGFWQCGPVEEVSLSRFANGQAVRVVDHLEPHYSPEEIVGRARSRLGESDYRLLSNNCEHFCNWCLSGVSRSDQVEGRLPLRLLGPCFTRNPRSGFLQ
jgi:Lecithin retinol acyltransferase